MALPWNLKKDFVGQLTIDGNTFNLYSGNALLIACYEWNEDGKDLYQVGHFFCDLQHLKNCLGVPKGTNIYEDYTIEIRLKRDYKQTPRIVETFAKAHFKKPLQIHIY